MQTETEKTEEGNETVFDRCPGDRYRKIWRLAGTERQAEGDRYTKIDRDRETGRQRLDSDRWEDRDKHMDLRCADTDLG